MKYRKPLNELLKDYIIKGEIDTETKEITIKSLRKKDHNLIVLEGGKGRGK